MEDELLTPSIDELMAMPDEIWLKGWSCPPEKKDALKRHFIELEIKMSKELFHAFREQQ